MKRSLIWTTAGIAAIGLAAPVFAARGDEPTPELPKPASVTVATPASSASAPSNTVVTVPDNSVTDNSVTGELDGEQRRRHQWSV